MPGWEEFSYLVRKSGLGRTLGINWSDRDHTLRYFNLYIIYYYILIKGTTV